jgi:hypothetical protein
VTASNYLGSSEQSDAGNGAYLMTIPGQITDLRDEPAITSASQIGLVWTKSTFESGSQVTDYKVEYD